MSGHIVRHSNPPLRNEYDPDYKASLKRNGGRGNGKGPELSIKHGVSPRNTTAARVDRVACLTLALERAVTSGNAAAVESALSEMAAEFPELAARKRRELT